jgi:hypothetical protein
VTDAEIMSSLAMNWEFFPPGTGPDVERFFRGHMKRVDPDLEEIIKERANLFWRLHPVKYLRGTGGMSRYVGALFAEDLVVFENVNYGNAIWILFENWAEISKRSRIELLRLCDVPFERLVHTDGWQDRFVELVRAEKKKRGIAEIRKTSSSR